MPVNKATITDPATSTSVVLPSLLPQSSYSEEAATFELADFRDGYHYVKQTLVLYALMPPAVDFAQLKSWRDAGTPVEIVAESEDTSITMPELPLRMEVIPPKGDVPGALRITADWSDV